MLFHRHDSPLLIEPRSPAEAVTIKWLTPENTELTVPQAKDFYQILIFQKGRGFLGLSTQPGVVHLAEQAVVTNCKLWERMF